MADHLPIMALANPLMAGQIDRDQLLHGLTNETTHQPGCTRASCWTDGNRTPTCSSCGSAAC